jgi:hypothetical protein
MGVRRDRWGVCLVIVATFALAGCGTQLALRGSATPTPAATPSATPSASRDDNRQTARDEASRLLSLVKLPPDAQPTSADTNALAGPALGTPSVQSLIDDTGWWQSSQQFNDVLAWLRAHPPDGLEHSGSASGTAGPQMAGDGYNDRDSSAWASAQLDIGVVPYDGGSLIRADAIVVWLDPKPAPDTEKGPRVHVDVGGLCPATDRNLVGVRNNNEDLRSRLLPDAKPQAGLVCRYDGMNGHPFLLRHQARLDRSAAGRLAEPASELPLSHADGGVTSCPMDDGMAAIVALSYDGQPDADLMVKLDGCVRVSNGYIDIRAGDLTESVLSFG